MRQFLEIKERHPDAIVFFRLGDFYEMFFEDAVIAAGLLDLTLTTRDKGKIDAVPMCGVPHHAARGYVAKLTELGHKVVICEQVEDPKLAKGLVRRDVVRIVTPGVVVDEEALDPKAARYVAALVLGTAAPSPAPTSTRGGRGRAAPAPPEPTPRWGLAYLDASTGEFRATELADAAAVADELARVGPREVIADAAALADGGPLGPDTPIRRYRATWGAAPMPGQDDARALLAAAVAEPIETWTATRPTAIAAAAAVLAYARATQPAGALPVARLALYDPAATMVLDEAAIANLELCATLVGGKRSGSLLEVLDETVTAPGARLLRRWLLYPLTDLAAIGDRADAVAELFAAGELRAEVRRVLRAIADLERLAGRAALGVAGPRDLGRMRDTLLALPGLASLVAPTAQLDGRPGLLDLRPVATPTLAALAAQLDAALIEQPAAAVKDGGFLRPGFDAIIDECRGLADGGKDAIAAIEARRAAAQRHRQPQGPLPPGPRLLPSRSRSPSSRRCPTTTSASRPSPTSSASRPRLREVESRVMGANERAAKLEREIFESLRERVAESLRRASGRGRSGRDQLDVFASAGRGGGAGRVASGRPSTTSVVLEIKDGPPPGDRGPRTRPGFVPNDTRLDPDREQLVLLTGPNMAGKSTFMRQVALIVLLAQIGSFVPAAAAQIGVVDRVFTRVGATDDSRAATRRSWSRCARPPRSCRHVTRRRAGDPRRGRPGHRDLRRRVDRVGGRRVPARRDRRADLLRDPLPRAGRAGRRSPAGRQRVGDGARGGR
jgi:DNA mismatch repair protein MutS